MSEKHIKGIVLSAAEAGEEVKVSIKTVSPTAVSTIINMVDSKSNLKFYKVGEEVTLVYSDSPID